MSKEMKKAVSKIIACCMIAAMACPALTANAAEDEKKEGFEVKFITNGSIVEYEGKQLKDGDVLTTYDSPWGWIETKGWFEGADGYEVDSNDINNPEYGPVKWKEIRFEHHVDGAGAVKFTVPEGNPMFEIEGDYDWMNYYGNSVFEIIGISEDLTVKVTAPYGMDEEPEDYSYDTDDIPEIPEVKETKDHTVTFVTNGYDVECGGKKMNDGDKVTTFKSPAVWTEVESWFVDDGGKVVDENDPDVGHYTLVENKRRMVGDGDGTVKFHVDSQGPGIIKIEVDGDYDYMGYTGAGEFEILGITEDVTVSIDANYNVYDWVDPQDVIAEDEETNTIVAVKAAAPETKSFLGDVNGDSKASAKDSMLIQRYAVNLAKLDDKQQELADVDGNGKVTNADAMNILRYSVKADVKYSIGEAK